MDDVSALLYTFFTNQTGFTNEVSTRIYPLVAREETAFPFVIYTIGSAEPLTKEAYTYPVTLNLYYEKSKYTECVTFQKTVQNLIETNTTWSMAEGAIDFVEEDQSIVATINFEIIN